MSAHEFRKVASQAAPLTERITLHLMGEPLQHPEFDEILKICSELGLSVEITTNGTLLKSKQSILFDESLAKSICQINFSLQSFTSNFAHANPETYLESVIQFVDLFSEKFTDKYINFRLWNLQSNQEQDSVFNQLVLRRLQSHYQTDIGKKNDSRLRKGIRLDGKNKDSRIYLHFDSRFEWPSLKNPTLGSHGTCHALTSQIGILADGTVVPCCLDKEGQAKLGNIFEQDLPQILDSPLAKTMKEGFSKKLLVHNLCQKCTYIERFK